MLLKICKKGEKMETIKQPYLTQQKAITETVDYLNKKFGSLSAGQKITSGYSADAR